MYSVVFCKESAAAELHHYGVYTCPFALSPFALHFFSAAVKPDVLPPAQSERRGANTANEKNHIIAGRKEKTNPELDLESSTTCP